MTVPVLKSNMADAGAASIFIPVGESSNDSLMERNETKLSSLTLINVSSTEVRNTIDYSSSRRKNSPATQVRVRCVLSYIASVVYQ